MTGFTAVYVYIRCNTFFYVFQGFLVTLLAAIQEDRLYTLRKHMEKLDKSQDELEQKGAVEHLFLTVNFL